MPKFSCKITRVSYEYTHVEVTAKDEATARELAIEKAFEDGDWEVLDTGDVDVEVHAEGV